MCSYFTALGFDVVTILGKSGLPQHPSESGASVSDSVDHLVEDLLSVNIESDVPSSSPIGIHDGANPPSFQSNNGGGLWLCSHGNRGKIFILKYFLGMSSGIYCNSCLLSSWVSLLILATVCLCFPWNLFIELILLNDLLLFTFFNPYF